MRALVVLAWVLSSLGCGSDPPPDVVRIGSDAATRPDAGPPEELDATVPLDAGPPDRVNATLEYVCGVPGDVALLLSADRRTDQCFAPESVPELRFPIHDGLPVVAPETFTRVTGRRCHRTESGTVQCSYADTIVTFRTYDETAGVASGTFDLTVDGVRVLRDFDAERCPASADCPPADAGTPDSGAPPQLQGAIFHTCDARRGRHSITLQLPADSATPCATPADDLELAVTLREGFPIDAPETFWGTDGVVDGSHCAFDGTTRACTEGQATLTFETYDETGAAASGRFTVVVDGIVYRATFDAAICDPPC